MILANPRSFRMSLRGRLPRITQIARQHDIALEVAGAPEEIIRAADRAVETGIEVLVVIGGDGTLQAVVSRLAQSDSQTAVPAIMMLGGGRTNYTARDIGTHRRLIETLERALDPSGALSETTRYTLQVEQDGHRPAHGFFIAGALVDYVIRECHHYRQSGSGTLRTGHVSTLIRLLQLAGAGLVGRSGFQSPEMAVETDELGNQTAPIRLLLITSLHHRREWIDPYHGAGKGLVRLTAVSNDAERFWRRIRRLLSGRHDAGMTPETGYLSGRCNQISIKGLKHISLDGQEYDFDPDLPVTIRTGRPFRFLHP
jgi:hypothetical protein